MNSHGGHALYTMHLYVVECNKGAQSFDENVSQMLAMISSVPRR